MQDFVAQVALDAAAAGAAVDDGTALTGGCAEVVLPRLPHPAVKAMAAMVIIEAGLMTVPSPERALAARPSRY